METDCLNSTMNYWEFKWEQAEPHLNQYDKALCILLGVCVLGFSSIFGIAANILCFQFFSTKSNVFFGAFRMVAACDIIICVLSTFYGLTYIFQRNPLLFGNHVFCSVWSVSWETMTTTSMYLVAIQCVMRTMKLWNSSITFFKSILAMTFVIAFLIIVSPFITSLFTYRHGRIVYIKSFASCSGAAYHVTPPAVILIAKATAVMLPIPFIIISCALCIYKLVQQIRSSQRRIGVAHLSQKRERSIISILAFSLSCLVLSSPYCYFMVRQMLLLLHCSVWENEAESLSVGSLWMTWFGAGICRRVCVSLNSVLNPTIYYWRIADFRRFLTARLSITPANTTQRMMDLGNYSLVTPIRRLLNRSNIYLTEASIQQHTGAHAERTAHTTNKTNKPIEGDVGESMHCQCECCYLRNKNVLQHIGDLESGVLSNLGLIYQHWETV